MAPPHRNLALSTRLVVRLRRRIHHYRCDRNGQPYPASWTRFAGDVALCAVAQPERLSSRRRRRRTSFVTHLLPPTRSDRAPAGGGALGGGYNSKGVGGVGGGVKPWWA